jgi:hypothetical protein
VEEAWSRTETRWEGTEALRAYAVVVEVALRVAYVGDSRGIMLSGGGMWAGSGVRVSGNCSVRAAAVCLCMSLCVCVMSCV